MRQMFFCLYSSVVISALFLLILLTLFPAKNLSTSQGACSRAYAINFAFVSFLSRCLSLYLCWFIARLDLIPLTQHQKRRLAQYKTHLRALANRKVSRKRKKTYLTQRGGSILAALLPPALGVLGSLF